MSTTALIPTIILFILGVLGTVVPLLPGAALIWVGMLLYGFLTGFDGLGFTFYLFQGLAVFLFWGVDYFATALGTRYSGGSRAAIWGAALGLLLGFVTMGPAGIIFGPFIGALVGEMINGAPAEKALRSSLGALVGLLGGLVIKLSIEAVMIYWFFKQILSA